MYSSIGNVELTDGAINLFKSSELTRLQEFYWLTFEDMFSDEIMSLKWVSEKDLEYIKSHREVEFARKETESWEMRKNLFKDPEWKRIKDFYWVNESDIRDVEILKKKWLSEKEIEFIIGTPVKNKEAVKIAKIKESIAEVESKQKKKWAKKD